MRGGVDDIDIGSGVGLIAREDADAAAAARGTQAIAREGAEGVTAGVDAGTDVVAREGVGLEPSGSAARRAKAAARESAQAVAVVPRELSPLGFYSHGAETAANLAQAKGTPDQMAAMLRKYGVKPDEFYNTGIADETATNVMRSKIERDYAPKLAAAKLEMDTLGLNENTINKKSPDYNRALEIRDSPETKAKYQYDRTLSAMRSEMDSAMVLRPEWASRPSVTREELAQHFSERRPQIEETVLGADLAVASKVRAQNDQLEAITKETNEISKREIAAGRVPAQHPRWKELEEKYYSIIDAPIPETLDTIFQKYTLPGGENYREVLLKIKPKQPDIETSAQRFYENFRQLGGDPGWNALDDARKQAIIAEMPMEARAAKPLFSSTHWDDPDVLAHLRMSDRTGPNGEKILHLEELQSDWGQKGRTEGFAQKLDPKILDQLGEEQTSAMFRLEDARDAFNDYYESIFRENIKNGFKDAPTQYDLPNALKAHDDFIKSKHPQKKFDEYKSNFLRQADTFTPQQRGFLQDTYDTHFEAKNAYSAARDKIAEYYSLSSGIPSAPYVTNTAAWTDLALKRALKEAAEGGYDRIVWTPGVEQAKRYSLFDKPREGMMNYYDKMVPNQLSKLVKRLDPDAKVGLTDVMLPQGTVRGMGHNNPPFEAPGLTITPKMREAIMKGQTDFAEGGHVQGYADGGSADNSLAALHEKYYGGPTTRISYAQGGSVDSAPVYDPAVIAAIAASITEDNYA